MKATDVALALTSLIPTKRPVYLWGAPGIGKSSLIHQAAKNNDMEVIDVRAVLLDPVDLRGLPMIDSVNRRADWCPPDFLPRDKEEIGDTKGVLFLDELAQAPPMVQAACLQLTLDRRIGDYELPPNWTVVAASNRQEDRAGAHRLISPLLNRFIHIDLEVSNEDWHAWAAQTGVVPEVRGFLNFRPALLFQFDPTSGARSFPTPRSWSFVSDVLSSTPDHLLHPVISGCVGEGAAAEFVGFCRIYRELPDVDSILADPKGSPVPQQPAVLYALSGALSEKVRKADTKLLRAMVVYAGRMPKEFSVLTFRDAAACNPSIFTLPEAAAWLKQHRNLLLPGAK